jgi:glycosyltransferase involved in cell wall biosynthesis
VKVAAVVAGGVPNPSQSGSALTVWTQVRHLLRRGDDVDVFVLVEDEHDDPGLGRSERVTRLEELGARVHVLRSQPGSVFDAASDNATDRLRRAWRPRDEEMLPYFGEADEVASAISDCTPEVVWAYHWETVAATHPLRGRIPRLATVVDLPQLSALYRWRASPGKFTRSGVSRLLWLQARLRHLGRLEVSLLNDCEASGNFAAHHAEWLRSRGAAGCEYLRTPIEDRPGADWKRAREPRRTDDAFRVFLIGHLRGISTLEGLDLFANETLPLLERELGDRLEVRIAGGYEPPAHLRRALERPSVRFLGHLEAPDGEFASADAVVVPTSVPLGTRVRILVAFSFGCPVVAHESNTAGIPELSHGENALLASDGKGLAKGVLRVVGDPDLAARLGRNGRETYERFFAPEVAGEAVARILERIAAPAGVAV